MSELRFTFEYDDGQWGVPLFYDNGKKLCFDEVVDLLNEQQATITHLEKVNGKNFAKRRLLEQDNLVLRNENEQLRQQQQRLYNYFRDYLEDEMSAENFGEMWDNVKEDERWNDE